MIFLSIILCGISAYLFVIANGIHKSESINKGILIFLLSVYLLSEVLSAFNWFTITAIRIISTAVLTILILFLLKKKAAIKAYFSSVNFKSFTIKRCSVLLLFLLLGVSALSYPPNNWDSNTYHLPRIIFWLQNHTLHNYPTPVFRQLNQPVFSEVVLSWIYSTYGPVSLLNLAQFFYFIFSLVIASSLLRKLDLSNKITFDDVAIFSFCVFSAVLEATNTKNDILLSYFILNFIYAWMKFVNDEKFDVFLFTTSVSLCILTKGTAFVYLSGISLVFIGLMIWKKKGRLLFKKAIVYKIITCIVLAAIVLTSFFYRNVELSGKVLTDVKTYQNEAINVKSITSNCIKNIALQLQPPLIQFPLEQWVNKLHHALNLPSIYHNDQLNYLGLPFHQADANLNGYFFEDTVPNFLLFLLTALSAGLFVAGRKRVNRITWLKGMLLFLVCFVLFSTTLKWQPWHTRLLIPLFFILCFSNLLLLRGFRYYNWVCGIVMSGGLFCIAFNQVRPLIISAEITENYSGNPFTRTYYEGLPPLWDYQFQYSIFDKYFEPGSLDVGVICNGNDKVFPYMWNNRQWKNRYFFIGRINNVSGKIQSNVPKLDYIITDKKMLAIPGNAKLINGYKKIEESPGGFCLFSKN